MLGLLWDMGCTPGQLHREKCFQHSCPQVENGAFEGKCFQRGGMLSAEVVGLVCWKHAGRSRGASLLVWGSRGEVHPTAATKTEEAEVLDQQHFLVALVVLEKRS